ncbi:MAG TPA: heavy metal sensor histidine kinase [Bacteroidia bacterium]|nr:heavy metal sensor histidine kinase [Bacteroidia bacterium]
MSTGSSMALGTRLLLAITAAALLTLSIAGCYLDHAMHRGLVHEHEELLVDHLAAVRKAVAADTATFHEVKELLHLTGADKNEKSYGALVDAGTGDSLAETPGFRTASPPLSAFPPPVDASVEEARFATATNGERHPVYITSALVPRAAGMAPLVYHYTIDAKPEQHFMQGFRLQIGAAVLGGTMLIAALGWIIVRRGLAPLHRITQHIESTTAKVLQSTGGDEAIPPESAQRWPQELATLASAFTDLRHRLGHAFRQLQQFSDDAAHEIRSPLNNLFNLASLALQHERTPEEYRSALESTLEECERLRKLADSLLFISRADHRKSALTFSTFPADEAIREIADYHAALASDKGVALSIRARGMLTADRMLFRQALTNLVSNAIRHTPAGGRIDIAFGPANGGATSVLVVEDTGEGIAEAPLPHLFDSFYRIDTARTRAGGASAQTGLGLAIVKTIADLHNAKVSVSSEVGKGSRFTILWPQLG